MSDAKPPIDDLAKQLKDSLARSRMRPWKIIVPAAAVTIVVLAAVAWWAYPRTRPDPLQIVALDAIYLSEETPRACALIHAPPTETGSRSLGGCTVVFREHRLNWAPNQKPREMVAHSDKSGKASIEWPVAQAAVTEFLALYIDSDQKGSGHELGRIFVWPKDAALLIVDADETLIDSELDADAAKILKQAASDGWHIVYLCLAGEKGYQFRTARSWLLRHQGRLPVGPVLGRADMDAADVSKARVEILKSLRSRFPGRMLAVVRNAVSAQASVDVGCQTLMIGAAPAPPGVTAYPKWADVSIRAK